MEKGGEIDSVVGPDLGEGVGLLGVHAENEQELVVVRGIWTRCQVQSAKCQVPGVRCFVPGIRRQVPNAKCQVSGVLCQVPSVRCQVPSAREDEGMRR